MAFCAGIKPANKPEIIISTLFNKIDDKGLETHYFIIPFIGKTLYLTQKFIIFSNGIFIFIIIALLNIYSRKLKFHLKHNKKGIMINNL